MLCEECLPFCSRMNVFKLHYGNVIRHWCIWGDQIDGLMQERRNSIANTLELRLFCTNPSKLLIHASKASFWQPIASSIMHHYRWQQLTDHKFWQPHWLTFESLTHWGRDKMADILYTAFSNTIFFMWNSLYFGSNFIEIQCGKLNFWSSHPKTDVPYMFYTKFHSPRPIFYLPSSKCTHTGERARVSFPH